MHNMRADEGGRGSLTYYLASTGCFDIAVGRDEVDQPFSSRSAEDEDSASYVIVAAFVEGWPVALSAIDLGTP